MFARIICLHSLVRLATWRPFAVAAALLISTLLQACQPQSSALRESTREGDSALASSALQSVTSDSVNYSHEYSFEYTLFDLSQPKAPAVGGGVAERLASGGEKACCIQLPAVWHEGLKVKVRWSAYGKQGSEAPIERTIQIPRYERLSDLYVVFHDRDDVELVVSVGEPGHPSWQGRVKQTPWDQCVNAHGRKPCKAVLPKMFDAASSRGYCTYTKSINYPRTREDGAVNCLSAMQSCMQDYEDEGFCHGLLWAEAKPSVTQIFPAERY